MPENSASQNALAVTIPLGTVLVGKYRTTREIGHGGMATVYEAEHLSLGKRVAIKVLAAELISSTVVIERFFREARAAASVKSPHIVDVYDSGRLEDGRPFIAMELLEGESLYDRMARVRILSLPETTRVISHCARGLVKTHAVGIVHRDLKPENIFITHGEDGEDFCKLLDFGLAKFYAPLRGDEKAARLTREGAVFGTPAYMSPEQVQGRGTVDHRSDLWALGCMAYECVIGRPVWDTDQGVAMTFAAIASGPVPVPSALRPDLPPSFDAWFKKALARDPDGRFQSAGELADALAVAASVPKGPRSFSSMSDGQTLSRPRPPPLPRTSAPSSDPIVELASSEVVAAPASHRPAPLPRPPFSSPTPAPVSPRTAPLRSPSAVDLPPTARNDSMPPPKLPFVRRFGLPIVAALVAAAGGLVTWFAVFAPVLPQPKTPTTALSASASDGGAPSAATSNASVASLPDDPRWASIVDGQRAVAAGDLEAAQRHFREAQDPSARRAGLALAEQLRVVDATEGSCRLLALSHPRVGVAGAVARPSVASGPLGAVVVWTDDHEQAGHEHAYTVLLDGMGHPIAPIRDVTPEGNAIARATLLPSGEGFALLYSERSGREAGVYVRWLDEEGRIKGGKQLVGAARPGAFWPAITRTADGFVVVWQDDRDRDGDDLFLRRLGLGLEPLGSEVRLSDFAQAAGRSTNARLPSLSFSSGALLVAYRLESGPMHQIGRLHIPLATAELSGAGLEERGAGHTKATRTLGDNLLVKDEGGADAPSLACGKDGCMLAWHGDRGGASVAMLEPIQASIVWRKKFAPHGAHPSLGVAADGSIAIAYFEQGRVKVAAVTRDGVTTGTSIGKTYGEAQRPAIAAAAPGEWLVAWQDLEGGKPEAFAARVGCK